MAVPGIAWRWSTSIAGGVAWRRGAPAAPPRDDRNREPLTVGLDALAAARARVVSYKRRLLVWARLLTDTRNAKAWPKVFADWVGLFDACLSVYDNLEPRAGSGGGNLRAEARRLTDQLQAEVGRGDAGRPAAADTAARLWALRDRWRPEFPGGDQRAEALLPALAAAVTAACEAEEAALAALAAALPS
jgi:hypothetical protein